jgi:hypothetical protein
MTNETVSIYRRVWCAEVGRYAWQRLYGPFASVPEAEASGYYQGPAFHWIWPSDLRKAPNANEVYR